MPNNRTTLIPIQQAEEIINQLKIIVNTLEEMNGKIGKIGKEVSEIKKRAWENA